MDFLRSVFPDITDWSPEDLLIWRLQPLLAADAKVQQVTGGAVDVFAEIVAEPEGRSTRLILAPSSNEETPAPGVRLGNIEILVSLQFDDPRPAKETTGGASVSTFFCHLRRVMNSAPMLAMPVGDALVPLANRMEVGPIFYRRTEISADRTIRNATMPCRYPVTLQSSTGRIQNLVSAGLYD